MKRSDIATLMMIAAVSMLVAYAAAQAIIGDPAGRQSARVQTVPSLSATVAQPDPSVFNSSAINPTIEVIVGQQATNGTSH